MASYTRRPGRGTGSQDRNSGMRIPGVRPGTTGSPLLRLIRVSARPTGSDNIPHAVFPCHPATHPEARPHKPATRIRGFARLPGTGQTSPLFHSTARTPAPPDRRSCPAVSRSHRRFQTSRGSANPAVQTQRMSGRSRRKGWWLLSDAAR